jgi:hypothetical protein
VVRIRKDSSLLLVETAVLSGSDEVDLVVDSKGMCCSWTTAATLGRDLSNWYFPGVDDDDDDDGGASFPVVFAISIALERV